MKFRLTLQGTAPLLHCNARMSNPLDPAAKALKKVSSKRTKTDGDHEEMAHLEFLGHLYYDPHAGPYVPAQNIERSIYDAAKMLRMGPKIKQGLFIQTDVNPLAYDGPRDAEKLWACEEFRHIASCKVGMVRVMRSRPMFPTGWRTEADGEIDTSVLDFEALGEISKRAGNLIGLGDWRPRYGRFEAELERL